MTKVYIVLTTELEEKPVNATQIFDVYSSQEAAAKALLGTYDTKDFKDEEHYFEVENSLMYDGYATLGSQILMIKQRTVKGK